jgi:hypothetical protein
LLTLRSATMWMALLTLKSSTIGEYTLKLRLKCNLENWTHPRIMRPDMCAHAYIKFVKTAVAHPWGHENNTRRELPNTSSCRSSSLLADIGCAVKGSHHVVNSHPGCSFAAPPLSSFVKPNSSRSLPVRPHSPLRILQPSSSVPLSRRPRALL